MKMNELLLAAHPFIDHIFLSKKELSVIQTRLKNLQTVPATIYTSTEVSVLQEKIRKGQVSLLKNIEIKDIFYKAVIKQCSLVWNLYKIKKSLEIFQYAIYNTGDLFHWHTDTPYFTRFNKTLKTDRTITAVLFLSDSKEYEGGILEVIDSLGRIHKFKNTQFGQVVIFPSHYAHRVTKVRRGVRKTLTLWVRSRPIW